MNGFLDKRPQQWPGLVELIKEKSGTPRQSQEDGETGKKRGKSSRVSRGHLSIAESIPEDTRNDILFREACSLREKGLTKDRILIMIRAIDRERCNPPINDDVEIETLVNSAWSYKEKKERELLDLTAPNRNTSDMGNASRMAGHFGDDIRFSSNFGWLTWEGARWGRDNRSKVQGFAKRVPGLVYREAANAATQDEREALARHAMQSECASRINAMIQLLPSEPGISVPHDVFDTNPWLFNVQNGTIDLRTAKKHEHRRSDMITKISPVTYDPDAQCPRWLQFLQELKQEQRVIEFIQRSLGYSLSGNTSEQVWFFLYGTGNNGKGVLIDTISYVIGDYAVATDAATFLDNQKGIRNDLARLRGARFVSAQEPSPNVRFDPSCLKSFTGQDTITARFLHQEFFEFKPEAKLFFSANHKPGVIDNSLGFWRRVRMIPFTTQFAGKAKDPNLREKLKAEASGILNWLIEGCLKWQQDGLKVPKEVHDAIYEYRENTDILSDFLTTRCVIGKDTLKIEPVKRLYDEYLKYCDENRIRKPFSRPKFNQNIEERQGVKQRRETNCRFWSGIGLRCDYPDELVNSNTYPVEQRCPEVCAISGTCEHPHLCASGFCNDFREILRS
ncbi:phage/plasmid primase, P4 family [Desulfomonile tiedjei]|uniref:Phage/plasmid primase, P4 family, C-terminal domain protein n=1 Tax=Desulfomonile tiedjei (strain ATCC 49306 / DSM 6799 / DCB-1) TaxID=706587 RepID=I4C8Y4_DESTA|nr:phage/plasmid primase, P4 family [Desulfomonile tiedjei]AFM26025.1 phage/plasmid primase, P4 family, C-terminal domain protein [Desulfomonile tiedjei DSM 6799]